jgi:hypothetical protein
MGANCGSQRVQIHPDPPRLLQGVAAVERLSVRLLQIAPDTGFVPGGQGVAGSNPAVPTQVRGLINDLGSGLATTWSSAAARIRAGLSNGTISPS